MIKLTQEARPDKDKPLKKPDAFGLVPAWSYSTLKTFEECPYRIYISKVRKVREPSGPAAERGSKIHQEAEDFVNGKLTEFPGSLVKFEDEFHQLKKLYIDGQVELEGEWAFTVDWGQTKWMSTDCWARVKLDAYIQEDQTSARVIDYKTGKKIGNEIPPSQQCLLYALAAFMRSPELEYVSSELWYLDHGETTTVPYTREEALMFLPGIHERAIKMTTCDDFAPNPSKNNCKWCSYKKGDQPDCQWGV